MRHLRSQLVTPQVILVAQLQRIYKFRGISTLKDGPRLPTRAFPPGHNRSYCPVAIFVRDVYLEENQLVPNTRRKERSPWPNSTCAASHTPSVFSLAGTEAAPELDFNAICPDRPNIIFEQVVQKVVPVERVQ